MSIVKFIVGFLIIQLSITGADGHELENDFLTEYQTPIDSSKRKFPLNLFGFLKKKNTDKQEKDSLKLEMTGQGFSDNLDKGEVVGNVKSQLDDKINQKKEPFYDSLKNKVTDQRQLKNQLKGGQDSVRQVVDAEKLKIKSLQTTIENTKNEELGDLPSLKQGEDLTDGSFGKLEKTEEFNKELDVKRLTQERDNLKTEHIKYAQNERKKAIDLYKDKANYQKPLKGKYKDSFLAKSKEAKDSANLIANDLKKQSKTFDRPAKNPLIAVKNYKKEDLVKLDSLLGDNRFKKKIKHHSDSVQSLKFRQKGLLKLGDYKELIIGIPNVEQKNFTLSPNVGFDIHKNFSAGVGLLLDVKVEEKELVLGYKGFMRYQFFKSYYLQGESTHFSPGISNLVGPEEKTVDGHSMSLAFGLGGTYKITEAVQFNVQGLYQVITSEVFPNQSPLIFRAGIKF